MKSKKYQLIINDFLNKIDSGELNANDQIPTEEELTQIYHVSRVTVRKAIEILVKEGYLEKMQGKGTFVNNSIIKKQLNKTVSFYQSTLLRGDLPSSIVHEITEIKPTTYLSRVMKLSPSADVIFIKRSRLTNDFPMIYEESYFNKEITGPITKEMAEVSIFAELKKHMKIVMANQEIDAIDANEKLAELLQVPVGFPLLRSVMYFYNDKNEIFETSINYHRTDRIKLTIIRNITG